MLVEVSTLYSNRDLLCHIPPLICFATILLDNPPFRWENAITVKVSQLKTKDGRDMIDINIMNRTKSICELLQHAVSVPDLDSPTRLDIATQSARLCLEGIPVSDNALLNMCMYHQ